MSARPEIIVDSFAGGGGTSEGIRQAIGRDPDIAINHNALALAMHRANHPGTHHMVEDVWSIDPLSMCDGRPIGLLWMSPDCKHFSKAKGGKPPREGDPWPCLGRPQMGEIPAEAAAPAHDHPRECRGISGLGSARR